MYINLNSKKYFTKRHLPKYDPQFSRHTQGAKLPPAKNKTRANAAPSNTQITARLQPPSVFSSSYNAPDLHMSNCSTLLHEPAPEIGPAILSPPLSGLICKLIILCAQFRFCASTCALNTRLFLSKTTINWSFRSLSLSPSREVCFLFCPEAQEVVPFSATGVGTFLVLTPYRWGWVGVAAVVVGLSSITAATFSGLLATSASAECSKSENKVSSPPPQGRPLSKMGSYITLITSLPLSYFSMNLSSML